MNRYAQVEEQHTITPKSPYKWALRVYWADGTLCYTVYSATRAWATRRLNQFYAGEDLLAAQKGN